MQLGLLLGCRIEGLMYFNGYFEFVKTSHFLYKSLRLDNLILVCGRFLVYSPVVEHKTENFNASTLLRIRRGEQREMVFWNSPMVLIRLCTKLTRVTSTKEQMCSRALKIKLASSDARYTMARIIAVWAPPIRVGGAGFGV